MDLVQWAAYASPVAVVISAVLGYQGGRRAERGQSSRLRDQQRHETFRVRRQERREAYDTYLSVINELGWEWPRIWDLPPGDRFEAVKALTRDETGGLRKYQAARARILLVAEKDVLQAEGVFDHALINMIGSLSDTRRQQIQDREALQDATKAIIEAMRESLAGDSEPS